ncbi:leader peptidase HopD [Kosakonia arachidis]|uniref:Leader peptidase HopD n=1 Tax=Kosakonia arachidis TaxID=551989 RepID=A0A1I7EBQ8_9ENTR|nr:A24 family peptidase [Kosakonia arachidis]SFU21349.1 leader peptidase HopD [Kosakonia arachidis]
MLFLFIYLSLNSLLVWHDIRSGLLPDRFTCPLLWAGLCWHSFFHDAFLQYAVWGAIAGYFTFAAVYWGYRLLCGREGMGYGDVKYLSALGAWHGWENLPALIVIASLLACCVAGIRCICTHGWQSLKNPLPLGPFLAAAGLLTGYQTLVSF